VLPELARVLRTDGLIVFTVPSDKFRELLDGYRTAPSKQEAEAYAKSIDEKFAHFHYHTADEWRVLFAQVGIRLIEARYYISPAAEAQWDRMNREYNIGGRSLFNVLASPRLRPLGYQGVMRSMVHDRLLPKLRPFYDDVDRTSGGGMLVVGRKM
jgi:SAM-dependent methyltransferase